MAKNWRTEIYDKLSPERRARIDAKADKLFQEIEIDSLLKDGHDDADMETGEGRTGISRD